MDSNNIFASVLALSKGFLLSVLPKHNRKNTQNVLLVSKETVVLRRRESETKIWFYQTG